MTRPRGKGKPAPKRLSKPSAPALDAPILEDDPDRLTPEQHAFCLEYIGNRWNGTRAYLAAYPNCQSYAAASVGAHKLLRQPKIRKRIDQESAAAWRRLRMGADEALARISISARADIGDAYDERGQLLPVNQWPASLRLAVKGIKPGPFGDTVALHDGLRASELMAINGGKLRQKVDLTHSAPSLAKLLLGKGDEDDDEGADT